MADWEYLIAGAGYVGARLLATLPPGAAIGMKRRATGAGRHRMLSADLDGPVPALPGARTIVYTVAPSPDHDPQTPDPRVERFLAALSEDPVRLVYFSTSGVYGDCGGRPVAETAPLRPQTGRARRRAAAEARLGDWCRSRHVAFSVLRIPGIYGPYRLGLERLQNGVPFVAEAEAGPGNRIHVDDLVRCARAAAEGSRPALVCNVGDGDNRSNTWFAGKVAELAGLPEPRRIGRAEARREFSARRLSFLDESRLLVLDRMRGQLGVSPRYADAADGIRASLREQGLL